MRIVLAPYGTRGDVEPMVALGLGLQARGHGVTIAAPENFALWVRSFGLEFAPAGDDIEAELRRVGDRAQSIRYQMPYLRDVLIPMLFERLEPACANADLLVGAGIQLAGPSVAERLRIPYAFVAYVPTVIESRFHPPAFVRRQQLPQWMNRILWRAFGAMTNGMLRGPVNRARARLGLAAIPDISGYLQEVPIILAAETPLISVPPDLPDQVCRTHSLVLAQAGTLPDQVTRFLDAGEPPLLVGFGSMVNERVRSLLQLFGQAARRTQTRLLIQTGWTALDRSDLQLPPNCMLAGAMPHAALLPRVRAVVHHGGAGTTTAVARAGRPQWVLPHLLDQHYWAFRVQVLGLGPDPVPVGAVRRASHVERALCDLVEGRGYARRAAEVSVPLQEGGGVDEACVLLEGIGGAAPSPRG